MKRWTPLIPPIGVMLACTASIFLAGTAQLVAAVLLAVAMVAVFTWAAGR